MSQIYLINPNESRILENAGDRLPIGLLSIASTLRTRGHKVKVFDMNHDSQLRLIYEFMRDKPEAVGISVYTSPILPEAISLASKLTGTRLIAGGYHATAMPKSLIPHFDAVVMGEGEEVFEQAVRENGIIDGRRVQPRLEEIPNPSYDLVDLDRYGMNQSGKRTATLITSRGCPFHCVFCGKLDDKVRYEPVAKVLSQANQLVGNGFQALYFLDDVFTLNSERMESILRNIQFPDVPYRVTTRANLVTEGRLDTLAETGCDWISLGIESGNDTILERSRKGTTTKQNLAAVQQASKRGINVKGFFIVGLPGETEKSAKQTVDFARFLRGEGLTKADFYYLTPFPGTPIWDNPDEFGITINNYDYTKYLEAGKNARCFVNTEGLKAERIEEIVAGAKKEWK